MVFYDWHWGKHLLWKGPDGVGYFLDKTLSSVTGRWVRLTCVKPTSVLTHFSLGPAVLYWIMPWEVAKTASALHHIHSTNWSGSRIRLLQGIWIYLNHTSKLWISHALKHQLNNSEWHFIIICSVWGHNMEQLAHVPFPFGMAITSFLNDQRFQSSFFCHLHRLAGISWYPRTMYLSLFPTYFLLAVRAQPVEPTGCQGELAIKMYTIQGSVVPQVILFAFILEAEQHTRF